MLSKTLALLNKVKSDTYLPNDTVCCEANETNVAGRLLRLLVYDPSNIHRRLQQDFALRVQCRLLLRNFYNRYP
jgi:hypothetical protein